MLTFKISKFDDYFTSVRKKFLFLIWKFIFDATIVFYCWSKGYPWATFVCSPLVAHRKNFETYRFLVSECSFWIFLSCKNYLVSVRKGCLFQSWKFSFAGKTVGYMGYHCFYCLSEGYPWATFVCSPLVAHRKDFETYRFFVIECSFWKFLREWPLYMTGVGTEDIWMGLETKWWIFVGFWNFFLENMLGYENKHWILAKICRFNILIPEWLIAQKCEMPFSINKYQIVFQKRYDNADFQNKISYHERKFHLESNKSIKYLSSGTKDSMYQVYPSWHAMIFWTHRVPIL